VAAGDGDNSSSWIARLTRTVTAWSTVSRRQHIENVAADNNCASEVAEQLIRRYEFRLGVQ
jgi:hypothetical protein